MKFFKKLAVLCAAITLCFGVGSSLTACGGNDESSSNSTENSAYVPTTPHASGYDFKVTLPEGANPEDYEVQLCTEDNAFCINPVKVGANGYVNYNPNNITEQNKDKEYVVHVMKNGEQLTKLEFSAKPSTIPANYDGAIIEIIITK